MNLSIGVVGAYMATLGYNTGWWMVLGHMMHFMPFYGMGIFYHKILEQYDKLSNSLYFTAVFAIQLTIIVIRGYTPSYSQVWLRFDNPVAPFVVGFIGIAFWLRVASLLEPLCGRSRLVNLIADNTYSIMINQFGGFMVIKTIFALISKFTNLCSEFDWVAYKTDLWYYYLPRGIGQTRILYLVAGIMIPIGIQWALNKLKFTVYDSVKTIANRRKNKEEAL